MTTLEQVKELCASAQQLQDAQAAEQSVKDYEVCRDEFAKQLQRLRALRRHAETLGPVLSERSESAVDWSAHRKRLAELRERMRDTSRVNLHETSRPFDALEQQWRRQLQDAWRSWCDKNQMVQMQAASLQNLGALFPKVAERLQDIAKQRAALLQKDLPGPEDVRGVQEQVRASEEALNDIGISDVEVRQGFQDLVVGDGVCFGQLADPTNKLRNWLDRHGLLADCRVRLP